MKQNKLDLILEKHKKWLNGDDDGEMANLRGADLRGADLRGADLSDANLRYADLRDANLSGADLRDANLRYADLRDANLRYADLRGADLRGADLRDANLDFSVFPLCCVSFNIKTDSRLPIQLLYHIARLDIETDDKDLIRLLKSKIFIKVCNKFHRVKECGIIKEATSGKDNSRNRA